MNDERIWAEACEYVGKWNHERGQKTWPLCPPINDPAAAMAMLKLLAPRYAVVKEIGGKWQVNNGSWSDTLPLALASAVVALPKEQP
jgi:hypothetical protein